MSQRRRKGYNWKARQQKGKTYAGGQEREPEKNVHIQLVDSLLDGEACQSFQGSNQQVLLPKRARLSDEETCSTGKRKKLNSKQRKRLLKVIERKEKKTKVSVLIKEHPTWQLVF